MAITMTLTEPIAMTIALEMAELVAMIMVMKAARQVSESSILVC